MNDPHAPTPAATAASPSPAHPVPPDAAEPAGGRPGHGLARGLGGPVLLVTTVLLPVVGPKVPPFQGE